MGDEGTRGDADADDAEIRRDHEPGVGADRSGASRRDFLRLGGAAAAGAVVGGAAGAAVGHSIGFSRGVDEFVPLTGPQKAGFDHLVVLMGENRSFDNLLGFLYTADDLPDGETFEGLAFGDHQNTAPDGTVVAAHVYEGSTDEIMGRPNPDPGEAYPHVNTQLFGTIDPPSNAAARMHEMKAPYNTPSGSVEGAMSGFLTDYWNHFTTLRKGTPPSPDEARHIMGSFSPQMLPVLSTLAKNFAVYDHWHCAVPSQTFCNRSFFHASTSHGFVTNELGGGYDKWLDAPAAPTVFNRLEEAGVSWRIYFDELQLVSFTGVLHAPSLEPYWRTAHFATMSQFYDDVTLGRLPAYSFIEPRMTYNHNDFHPPVGKLKEDVVDGEDVVDSAISDVRAGEALVHQIYEAIRASASPTGSNALNTMFLITFDEHGGTYDHVTPPVATPPHDHSKGEMGFGFDRLGCRVPAIAVSAFTRAGTVVHDEMHHAAVIATLSRLHGLDPLTRRDADAKDLFNVVNLDEPRQPVTWPSTTPQYIPPNPQAEAPHPANAHKDKPLSPPAQGLLGLLIAKYGSPDDEVPQTYADAYELLHRYGVGLFGKP